MISDSGGRGLSGATSACGRAYRLLEPATASMMGQHCLFGFYVLTGLFAGETGRAGRVLILGSNGRVRQTLRGKGVGRLRAQSWRTPIVGIAGGGRYGRREERSGEAVQGDVTDGYVAPDGALRGGVTFEPTTGDREGARP